MKFSIKSQPFFVKCQLSIVNCQKRGMSLLEVLIVIAIIAILGAAGVGYFRNTVKNIEVEEITKTLVSDIKNTRAKSMAGENNMKWGVHIVNSTNDYYEMFSTPTNYADVQMSVLATTTLSRGIVFSNPAEGFSNDIIFSKVGGTTTPATAGISSEGRITTITITAQGTVY